MINGNLCTSFKSEILSGTHDLSTDSIRAALYTSSATLNSGTTAYSATNEIATDDGYTTKGVELSGFTVSTSGTTAYADWTDATWTFTAERTMRGALIYNDDKSDRAIMVIDFGFDITSSGTFTITFPANTANSAILRIS